MDNNDITPFLFEGEITVRVTERNGILWSVVVDVCRALGIANASQAIRHLDDDEKDICSTYTPGGTQELLIVSESGLFSMILRSRDAMKPGTLPHRFRRWVTSEVLPTIRRKGQYQVASPLPQSALPEAMKLRMVAEARQVFGVRAAGEVWFRLGLPTTPMMHLPSHQFDLFMVWNRNADGASPQA